MGWESTAWGIVCTSLHTFLAPEYPDLVLCIGPDDWSRHEGRAALLFLGPGQVSTRGGIETRVAPERFEPPIKASAPPGKRPLFDRIAPIVAHIFWPYPSTGADDSQERCEDLFERVLDAINTEAHIRASDVQSAAWLGGSAGANGTTCVLEFSLRFTVYAPRLRTAKPESSAIDAAQVAAPAGTVVEEAIPGV